jgi:hypothetical protein
VGLYSHYDGEHNHPVNRALHLIAIPLGFSSAIVVWFHWIIALLLIPTAFALAWLGHLIEGNKPAFLTNPAHVFVAPVWMAKRIFGKSAKCWVRFLSSLRDLIARRELPRACALGCDLSPLRGWGRGAALLPTGRSEHFFLPPRCDVISRPQ